jgi:septum formation protein
MMQKTPLILASGSPRRTELLTQIGVKHTVIISEVDESRIPGEGAQEYVRRLARAKAEAGRSMAESSWPVLGADTTVVLDQTILGKPADPREARAMLQRLSGQSHFVFTGYAILCKARSVNIAEAIKTVVEFKRLTGEEIDWYVQTGEPFDKAGAYAIQGMGTFLVRRIDGSYTNVVGLPVCEVIETLLGMGAISMNPERDAIQQAPRQQGEG